jgi:hypothetical protein
LTSKFPARIEGTGTSAAPGVFGAGLASPRGVSSQEICAMKKVPKKEKKKGK